MKNRIKKLELHQKDKSKEVLVVWEIGLDQYQSRESDNIYSSEDLKVMEGTGDYALILKVVWGNKE